MLCVFSSKHNCARIWIYICQFIYIHAHIHALKYFEDHVGYVRWSYHSCYFEARSLAPSLASVNVWLHSCSSCPHSEVLGSRSAALDLSPFWFIETGFWHSLTDLVGTHYVDQGGLEFVVILPKSGIVGIAIIFFMTMSHVTAKFPKLSFNLMTS